MLPFLPAANPTAPPPIQTTSFEGVQFQAPGAQRVPAYAVPTPVNILEPYNNTRPNGVVRGGAAVEEASATSRAPQTAAASNVGQPAASTTSGASSTTLFLTQLMGQGGGSNLRLASSFFPGGVAPGDPAVFDAYADVKYMPSLAGKYSQAQQAVNAQQAPQQNTSALQRAEQAQQVVTEQRTQVEQARTQDGGLRIREAAPAVVNGQASLTLGVVNRNVNDRNLPALRGANDNQAPNLEAESLLGEGGGVNAYLAASTRSALNITIPAPRFVFVE